MKKHLFVVGAIFLRGDEIFAARKGKAKYEYVSHKYEFVGGKLEAGESEEAALVRELREEMELSVRVLAPYCRVEHEYPDFAITLSTFLCEMTSPFLCREHEEAAWLKISALNAEEWAPADAPIIEKIKAEYAALNAEE